MPQIDISPQVAAHIGDEQVQRFRSEPSLWIGECWECLQRVDAAVEPVSLLLLQVPQELLGPGEVVVARLAHRRCAGSRIEVLDPAQPRAQAELASLLPGSDGAGDVIAMAGMSHPAAILAVDPQVLRRHPELVPAPRPTLLLSFREMAGWSATGERVNLLLSEVFLPDGWELAGNVNRTPAAVPDGWSVQYRLAGASTSGPGELTIFRPGPTPYLVVEDWSTPELWTAATYQAGEVSVYAGALGLHAWTHHGGADLVSLQRAARQGQVVGARLPVAVLDRWGRRVAPSSVG